MLLMILYCKKINIANILQKTNETEFRIEKVIKRKADKLYAKLKVYDTSFNSWIDKKDSINE